VKIDVNMNRVLIIGGSGFIGKHLVPHICNYYGSTTNVFSPGKEELDITSKKSILHYLKEIQPESIINLAGLATVKRVDPNELFKLNTIGFYFLLEAIEELNLKSRVITCSSAYVYPQAQKRSISETSTFDPQNLYAVTKIAAEMSAKLKPSSGGVVIARLFNIVGQGQKEEFLLPNIITQVVNGNRSISVNNLSDRRDFVDVRDACDMFRIVLDSTDFEGPINFCNGEVASVLEVVEILKKVCGFDFEVVDLSDGVQLRPPQYVLGDVTRLTMLGYKRSFNLNQTINWMYRGCLDSLGRATY
jgi:GDP-6-deoxy-D-talose 4-dehydrogenase